MGLQRPSELSYQAAHANQLSLVPRGWDGLQEHVAAVQGSGATRDGAPPGTGSAAPPPPSAERIHTSITSAPGRNRGHLPAHMLTDTTNRHLRLGDSVQSCCLALEPSPRLLMTWQPLPCQICAQHPALLLPPGTGTPGARLSLLPLAHPDCPWHTQTVPAAPGTPRLSLLPPGTPRVPLLAPTSSPTTSG